MSSLFFIGVSGASASGKTTVCEKLISSLGAKACIVSFDSFYKNLTEEEQELAARGEYNFDHPDALDFKEITNLVLDLKAGKVVHVPGYDFKTNSRTGIAFSIDPSFVKVVIVEGIMTFFHKELREVMDLKLYVETDSDTCLARRILRDMKNRGRPVKSILHQYETFVKPCYESYIAPMSNYADIVIPRGGKNNVAIDLIVQYLRNSQGIVENAVMEEHMGELSLNE
eukprot:GCRY01002089.1.p1 GENE.GCRY01002089.1~~GCRY01002089.1.p1  ORF type:complete len:227 (+),score=24.93 GCRY01002089.1:204-884(+)